jgi:chorismate synthase
MSESVNIQIRALTTIDEFEQAERLQQLVWDDNVIHMPMLVSLSRNGGLIVGAMRDNEVVGCLVGYLGLEDLDSERPAMANLKFVSQRMAVRPEYRNSGIGFEMKMVQRQFAIQRGIRLITWTFDPLLSRNAHLNIRKLGGITREYVRDYYGAGPTAYVPSISSDRLICEWWVTTKRVEQRLYSGRIGLTVNQYLEGNANLLNPSRGGDAQPRPFEGVVQPGSLIHLVEIPENYEEIASSDPTLADSWRFHIRNVLQTIFERGYIVTDFVRGEIDGRNRCFYVASLEEALKQFNSEYRN